MVGVGVLTLAQGGWDEANVVGGAAHAPVAVGDHVAGSARDLGVD